MILYNEIKENGELDVMKLLDNGYDPFLCDKCQKHGYCIEKYYQKPYSTELVPFKTSTINSELELRIDINIPITESEVSNIVNIRTDIKEARAPIGKKLQQAHDFFHQDEFEQASYIYLDILETRNDITEAWKGLCASFYFLGKYEEAVATCMKINFEYGSSFVNRFIKGCDERMEAGFVHDAIEINHFSITLQNS